MEADVAERLAACEKSNRRLLYGLAVVAALSLAAVGLTFAFAGRMNPAHLRVSELVVVDERDVVRIRIGGELPDATIRGRRVERGDEAAGMLLYDTTGQERGGYVTLDHTGHIGITLDSRDGQTAVFRADSTGSTALRLWTQRDAVELKTDPDGARVNVLSSGQVSVQIPLAAHPQSTTVCTDLRSLMNEYEASVIQTACRERMTDEACSLCLEPPQQ